MFEVFKSYKDNISTFKKAIPFQLMGWLDRVSAACGSRCTTFDIGNSFEGRGMKAIKVLNILYFKVTHTFFIILPVNQMPMSPRIDFCCKIRMFPIDMILFYLGQCVDCAREGNIFYKKG